MKRTFLLVFLATTLVACTQPKMVIMNVGSSVVEEDGFYVKRLMMGERTFEVQMKELSRKGDMFRLKGTVVDQVSNDSVPYPILCLVSIDGSRYRIVKELCVGDVFGNFDCIVEWEYPKEGAPYIVIDALGYRGTVYAIMSAVHENQLYEVLR